MDAHFAGDDTKNLDCCWLLHSLEINSLGSQYSIFFFFFSSLNHSPTPDFIVTPVVDILLLFFSLAVCVLTLLLLFSGMCVCYTLFIVQCAMDMNAIRSQIHRHHHYVCNIRIRDVLYEIYVWWRNGNGHKLLNFLCDARIIYWYRIIRQ